MFERFSTGARRTVVLAQEEARMLDHGYIGTEHILLGLLHEEDGLPARVIESMGLDLTTARAQVEQIIGRGDEAPSGHIPFTPRARKILELSLREALEQKKNYIGSEHILLGLLREGSGVGAQILARLGAPLPAIRQRVLEVAETWQPEPGSEAPDDPDDPAVAPSPWPAFGAARGPGGIFRRGAAIRVQGETIGDLRELLTSIDRRLAAIEQHLGIASSPSTPAAETALPTPEGPPEGPSAAGNLEQPATGTTPPSEASAGTAELPRAVPSR